MLLYVLITAGARFAGAAAVGKKNLNPAATTTRDGAQAQPTTITPGRNSTDPLPYNPDASSYYLGYRGADFEKPYAKYWNPVVQPLDDAFQKGLSSSPWASGLTYTPHDAHDYFARPGYDAFENGWSINDNGTLMIATRSEMPQVTGEAYDWWFAWHQSETQRYKLWNPVAHAYVWRVPQSLNWTGLSYRERWINTTSFISEYVGNDADKISIGFIDPATVGFDTSKWPDLNIETIVVGQLLIGKHSTTSFDGKSYLMHQIRRMPNGYRELRSRFWVAKSNHGTAQLGHDLAVHCNIEMTHLGAFLPALFEEFKDTY